MSYVCHFFSLWHSRDPAPSNRGFQGVRPSVPRMRRFSRDGSAARPVPHRPRGPSSRGLCAPRRAALPSRAMLAFVARRVTLTPAVEMYGIISKGCIAALARDALAPRHP